MNKLHLALSACMAIGHFCLAQNIVIPDANFKSALVNDLVVSYNDHGPADSDADTNNDGEISISEALAVKHLNIRSKGIKSIAGLEYFENLVSLDCSGNDFDEFILKDFIHLKDLSFLNHSLKRIVINGCPLLKELKLSNGYPYYEELDYIDVSNNGLELLNIFHSTFGGGQVEDMQYINCSNNNLTQFDLGANSDTIICSNNSLEHFRNYANLYLDISYNQISRINGVGTTIEEFIFNDNPLEFLEFHLVNELLEITNFPELERIIINGNNNTKKLIIKSLPDLKQIYLHTFGTDTIDIELYDLPNVQGNLGGINCTMDVQRIESLRSIDLTAGELNISNCPGMTQLFLRNQYDTNIFDLQDLKTLELEPRHDSDIQLKDDLIKIYNLPQLDSLYIDPDGRQKKVETYNLPNLSYIDYRFHNTIDTVNIKSLLGLEKVNFFGNPEAIHFEDLPKLADIFINANDILKLEFDELVALSTLSIKAIDLDELELSNLDVLDSLHLEIHNLNLLELKDLPSLRELSLEQLGTSLTKEALEYLKFYNLSSLEKIVLSDVWTDRIEAENLAKVKSIYIHGGGHNVPLSKYKFVNLPALDSITLRSLQVEELEMDDVDNLDYIHYVSNGGMEKLSIINLPVKELVYNKSSFPDSELLVSDCTSLETIVCSSGNNKVPVLTNLPALKKLELKEFSSSVGPNQQLSLKEFPLLERIVVNYRLRELELGNPQNLQFLDISKNKFINPISLSNLPSLDTLHFTNNNGDTGLKLYEVPNLEYVDLIYSDMNELDFSNVPKLKHLNVRSTSDFGERIHLNLKNGTNLLEVFEVNGNDLSSICVDNNEEAKRVLELDEHVENTPFTQYCSFEPGGRNLTVYGTIGFQETSGNCYSYFPENKVILSLCSNSGKVASFSDQYGDYRLVAPFEDDTFILRAESLLPNYKVTPDSILISYDPNSLEHGYDFCIEPIKEIIDTEITLVPINAARPGFNANYKLVVNNLGTQVTSGNVILEYQDAYIDLESANPDFESHDQNKLIWRYENLAPFESEEFFVSFNLNSPMESPALVGDEILNFKAESINDESDNEENTEDNLIILDQLVVNSHDPNDKTCLNGSQIDYGNLDQFLHYLIRFENNGSASAVNIVVKDIIDVTRFDMSTFTPLESSHKYVAKINEDNVVEFIFENIYLPHEDDSNDGYVNFKIKPLQNLSLSDTLANTADIFFDFNWPIITNTSETVVTRFSDVLSLDDLSFDAQKFDNQTVNLSWSITSSSSYEAFKVQRRHAGGAWTTIDKIDASVGNDETEYSLIDGQPHKGHNFYRLVLVGKNGNLTFSKIKSVNIDYGREFRIYPNPVVERDFISIEVPKVPATLILSNTLGQQIWKKTIYNHKEQIAIDQLIPGIYYCLLEDGSYREIKHFTLRN